MISIKYILTVLLPNIERGFLLKASYYEVSLQFQ
jgi:hypothetical protein